MAFREMLQFRKSYTDEQQKGFKNVILSEKQSSWNHLFAPTL